MIRTLITTLDFPPTIGGIQTTLYSLCQHCQQSAIRVVAPKVSGASRFDAQQVFAIDRAMRWFPRTHSGKSRLPSVMLAACRAARRQRPDVVLCSHVITAPTGWLLKRLMGIPYVVYTHALEVMDKRYRRAISYFLRDADHIIVVSDFVQHFLVNDLGLDPSKLTKVSPGINIARFKPNGSADGDAVRSTFGLQGANVLLTVGRLAEKSAHKGHDTVIRSLPVIREHVPNVKYLIVGDGDRRERLEQMAVAAGVREDVIFAGRQPDDTLPGLYAACDIFAMPCRVIEQPPDVLCEGFGIAFLEANAMGRPVIGGRSGGVTDAVAHGQSGLLVDPPDEKRVAEAVITLLKDPELAARLGRQGQERVHQLFNWEKVAAQVDHLLSEVAPSCQCGRT